VSATNTEGTYNAGASCKVVRLFRFVGVVVIALVVGVAVTGMDKA
jgi:hypothetical protein